MEPDHIIIRGARQHNLKNIEVHIPRNKLVVLTGVSGSGKSSLAFDTLYAEGQRRYVESLSSYARQFLGQMDKPDVDYIGGLSPSIAIEQKAVSKNPRSTVGTVTDVLDYLRVLFARIGIPHCPQCGRTVQPQSAQQISTQLAALPAGTRFQLLAPVVNERKGSFTDLIENALRDGFSRARIDGVPVELDQTIQLGKTKKHTIELIVDRLQIPPKEEPGTGENAWTDFLSRLIDSVETTLEAGSGVLIADIEGSEPLILSEHNACPTCNLSFPDLSPQLFSFNSPVGMCPACSGLGTAMNVDASRIIEHPEKSILDGALRWYGELGTKKSSWGYSVLSSLADHFKINLEEPWQDLPDTFRQTLIYGSGKKKVHLRYVHEGRNTTWSGESLQEFEGIIPTINRRLRQTRSEQTRRWYMSFMSQLPCPVCHGTRLRPEAAAVRIGNHTISSINSLTIAEAYAWIEGLRKGAGLYSPQNGQGAALRASQLLEKLGIKNEAGPPLPAEAQQIAKDTLNEIRDRLRFMLDVGLHYLNLDRPAASLSGGESQRIRLASQIGCGLVGVLYILDEPSIGLHARDNLALLETLVHLRSMGNTVLIVEHDAETMNNADWIIDLGPGAGILGGEITAEGTPFDLKQNRNSLTGKYLAGICKVSSPNGQKRRKPQNGWLNIEGASLHNLKDLDARIPLGCFTCVTGVSGSGKSSLISETLYPALAARLHNSQSRPGPFRSIHGIENLDKVISITQDPIGRTPRSNPATYVKLFDHIRAVFASTPEAKSRGYQPARFSFNIKGGRCEACQGHGQKRIEMHFLADVWVQCKECGGKRYNKETLAVRFKEKSIAEILEMDVQEALDFFANHHNIARILQTLKDVGLEYLKLGQSATTLSGGEAQRVKLAKELGRASTGRTFYILDEPTTGLHFADIQHLLDVLHRLTAAGNTVVVIEHNLDVIKTADWILDLGPEGGDRGGYLLGEGSPEDLIHNDQSYTARYLAPYLE
ncbi:MAG: excinuclease ABC subunit UvrA [Anaerolineales bacterium]|nr:excinuclease ABC subunit UvrA [Anaerolineales bacterium]